MVCIVNQIGIILISFKDKVSFDKTGWIIQGDLGIYPNRDKMLDFLKNYLFAVEAYFESSKVLTFAVPKDRLQKLIPECLELDTLNDEFGFITVAIVQTKALRPKEFPKFLGNNFFLIGYRILYATQTKKVKDFVVCTSSNQKPIKRKWNIWEMFLQNIVTQQ